MCCRELPFALRESIQHEQRVECQHCGVSQQQQREQQLSRPAGLCYHSLRYGQRAALIARCNWTQGVETHAREGEQSGSDVVGLRAGTTINRAL